MKKYLNYNLYKFKLITYTVFKIVGTVGTIEFNIFSLIVQT